MEQQPPVVCTTAWGSPPRPNTNMSTITSDEEIEHKPSPPLATTDVKFSLPDDSDRPTTAITPPSPITPVLSVNQNTTDPVVSPPLEVSEAAEAASESNVGRSGYPKVVLMKHWVQWKPEYVFFSVF